MDFTAAPTLTGRLATLEQLSTDHTAELADAVADGELWRTWYTNIPTPDAVPAEIDRRLAEQAVGMMAPWAIRRTDTGAICGLTTYMNIAAEHARVEIGSTWMAPSAQGTGINPDAKLLLLTRAFETLGCNVVEFRTHWHNQQSRAAIARLGAKQDGVLRNNQVWKDGSLRDTVVFSIISGEWPAVRSGLTARVARHAASGR
ncbi:GNAT family N-acetyltransferase [Rathayibacter soli]|uniref:GNAT family N-acetyltransferase n=1 Tax=Rathayibacter soli TaxID=3144168 RepID=UPI0027E41F12|nr:GNAT family protein [Glaciibacter superstes]